MPKYYCDYCDTYLTHDSPSVRKTHCNGRKHKENVKFYYQKWMEEQAQSVIDQVSAAFKANKMANPKGGPLPPLPMSGLAMSGLPFPPNLPMAGLPPAPMPNLPPNMRLPNLPTNLPPMPANVALPPGMPPNLPSIRPPVPVPIATGPPNQINPQSINPTLNPFIMK